MNATQKNEILSKVSKHIFWDCDMQTLDFEKEKSFIISRILMRGTDREIRLIENMFSLKEIVQAVKNSFEADAKCINFYETLYKYE